MFVESYLLFFNIQKLSDLSQLLSSPGSERYMSEKCLAVKILSKLWRSDLPRPNSLQKKDALLHTWN